jgi:hypothetical protein
MNHRILIFGIIILFLCFFSSFPTISSIFENQENYSCSFGGVRADTGIDPEITGLSMNLPEHVQAGTYLRIVDILRNQGLHASGPFSIGYIMEDPLGVQKERMLGTVTIQNLVRGGQKKINTTFPVPPDIQSGNYIINRLLNPEESISEDSRKYLSGGQKALKILDYSEGLTGYTDDLIYSGDAGTLLIRSIISNTGGQDSIETKLSYYLSQSGLISDDLISLGESDNLIVPVDEQIRVDSTLSLPEDIPDGEYFLISAFLPLEMVSDDSSLYWVSEEPISLSVTIPTQVTSVPDVVPLSSSIEPDIMTVKTDYPDVMYIGESSKITDSITNIGSSTAGIVRVEYLLSSDDDGSDAQHLDWWTLHNLKGGETRTGQVTVGIPGGTRTGIYYLTKKITVTSSPPEKNTANNFWTGNRPVRIEYNPAARIPDLTHVTTKFPCAQPGDTVEITDTITNIGNACADHVQVAYYLSPYASFDPSTARYLGVWDVSRICVGEQQTRTITVSVPADLRNGEYYWFSVIDPCTFMPYCGDEMPELDKSNNINIGRLYIGPCVFCGC